VIITLLTDFGSDGYFVGAMKGVILKRNRGIRLIDITHVIARQNVSEAAFVLLAVYREFPPGSVHLAVVDPGVGSARRSLAIAAGGFHFVGPDNGIFDYVLKREREYRAHVIENPEVSRESPASTFHGRDVFAPAAAALAEGFPLESIGSAVENLNSLPHLNPIRLVGDALEGRILHVDRFGNCVTNITALDVDGWGGIELRAGGNLVREVRAFYAAGSSGEPFLILGSAGFLEISVSGGSAAAHLGIDAGFVVTARPLLRG